MKESVRDRVMTLYHKTLREQAFLVLKIESYMKAKDWAAVMKAEIELEYTLYLKSELENIILG